MNDEIPKPGDIVLLKIKQPVGAIVWLMQAFNRDLSKWTHAAVMLDDETIFEAQPGGSVMTPWSEYEGRPFAIVSKVKVGEDTLPLQLTDKQRRQIVQGCWELGPIGYGYATYLYLALYRFGIRPEWLKKRVRRTDRMICSQACDAVYNWVGVCLFDDGRMPCDLTPGDLSRLV